MKIGVLLTGHTSFAWLQEQLEKKQATRLGLNTYVHGFYGKTEVVAVSTSHGKVATSLAATVLAIHFSVDQLFLFGFCGSLRNNIIPGDIIVPESFVQYDADVSALGGTTCEIPLHGFSRFSANKDLTHRIIEILSLSKEIKQGSLHRGCMGSADTFVADRQRRNRISKISPEILTVDMESASLAHVGYEYNLPIAVIKLVSDTADHSAVSEYESFIKEGEKTLLPPLISKLLSHVTT
ncbi:5'-methylthioadenosine/S-adenosylhomocysteine nucleosidase [Chitinivibrio alkaliphilus]|uniref:adenosylhomocysteine nucleosidase n=1 Tax=Chitinivibrio alkaliphilus ACht1 TaxID=1313304 RepID=U7DAT1_9BACT|nr:5'-methylthioadenosine/S-adenosylhomocysteine nucleosidase [Chitinivibrio alkaliphilus]ERP39137.1 MTA/SAH nucleosidase [Chitinivibrio alkaliphilus ACht1]